MRKTLRSLLAYCLAVLLLVQSAPFAFAEETMPSVTVADNSCTVGSSVTMIVTGENFENLAALPLELYYDADVLTLNNVSIGSAFTPDLSDINTGTAGKIVVGLIYSGDDGISVSSGTLLYLNFTVADDAVAGDTDVVVTVGNARYADFSPMAVSSTSGTLTISEQVTPVSTFYLSGSTNASTFSKGDTVTLQVYNSWMLGVSAGTFLVSFDDELFKVKNAAFSNELLQGECLTVINDNVAGQVSLSFVSDEVPPLQVYSLFSVELEVTGDVDTTTTLTYAVTEAHKDETESYNPSSNTTHVTLVKLPEVVDYPNLSVNSTEFTVGEKATSTLTLEASDVAAADFFLHFDPEILEVVSVEKLASKTDSKAYIEVDETTWDEGIVQFTYLNTAGTVQDLPLLKITWNVISAKTNADLSVSGSGVVDVNLKDVALEYVGETSFVYPIVTISFNSNGGSGAMADQTVRSGTELTLDANTFTRVDYTFNGWNTKADGTGTAYADKATITATNATTLYAQWEIAEAHWGLATGEELDELPSEWESWGTFANAMTYANGLTSGTAYIQLLRDVDTTAPLVFDSGKTTILDLNGKTIDRGLSAATANGKVISVNGNLTLCDSSSTAVADQGVITGGNNSGICGGVYVGGTFVMNGGNISKNTAAQYGGGVYVGGTFIMSGGTISENNSNSLGGGVHVENGTFIMNGGVISKNTATHFGGGVVNLFGTFTMKNGSITENVAGTYGAGVVCYAGNFTMNNGSIAENVAEAYGAGVVVNNSGTFTMSSGSIAKNTAGTYGAGVACNGGTFVMNGGTIAENVAAGGSGGVSANFGGTFTMSGGVISKNSAGIGGGGVATGNGSTFIMSGGAISENTAVKNGGGVWISPDRPMQLSGASIISGNKVNGVTNNIYLEESSIIEFKGSLAIGASIGITTATAPTSTASVTAAQGSANPAYTITASDAAKFTSDSGHLVELDSANNAIVLAKKPGVTVNGTITSYLSDTNDVTVALFAEGSATADYTATVKGKSANFSIDGVSAGTYTMKVSKTNHVTREYTVTVGDTDVTQNAKIHPKGDVTGDGNVNIIDVNRANLHYKNKSLLSGYEKLCADVTGEGSVNIIDVNRLNLHYKNKSLLW